MVVVGMETAVMLVTPAAVGVVMMVAIPRAVVVVVVTMVVAEIKVVAAVETRAESQTCVFTLTLDRHG